MTIRIRRWQDRNQLRVFDVCIYPIRLPINCSDRDNRNLEGGAYGRGPPNRPNSNWSAFLINC